MRIKVLGKSHLEGTSKKTGQKYNFNQIHYLGGAFGVEGQAALVQSLDPIKYPIDSIHLNEDYIIEFDNRGYVVTFEPVEKKMNGSGKF